MAKVPATRSGTDATKEATDPRSFFAAEILRLREAAGWSQVQLGDEINVSADYASKLERGVRPPTEELAVRLDIAFKTDGHFMRLYELAQASGGTPSFFAYIRQIEKTARVIEEYAPSLIPGLLQTPEYATETFKAVWPYLSVEGIEEKVRDRIERSALLDESAVEFWAILDEAVLHDRLTEGVMAGQLAKLVDLIEMRRIVLQVLPRDVGMHALRTGYLMIMTLDDGAQVAYTEGPHTGSVMDTAVELAACRRSYDLVRAVALSPAASLALIKAALEEYKHHE